MQYYACTNLPMYVILRMGGIHIPNSSPYRPSSTMQGLGNIYAGTWWNADQNMFKKVENEVIFFFLFNDTIWLAFVNS